MNNGGYKIIDFNSVDRNNGVSMVCEGIYNDIESTRKAILVSGLVIDGRHEYHDEIVKIIMSGSNFYLIGEDFIVEITDRDVVTPIINGGDYLYNSEADELDNETIFYKLVDMCYNANAIFKGRILVDMSADIGVRCVFNNFYVNPPLNELPSYFVTGNTSVINMSHDEGDLQYIIGMIFTPGERSFEITYKQL